MPTDAGKDRCASRRPGCLRVGGWLAVAGLSLGLLAAQARAATVFAAASLADALKEAANAFLAEKGEKVSFNFAGSNVLARQIEAGAPADLFFSADEAQMDRLDRAGLLVGATRRDLLGNSLVVVVAPGDRGSISDPASLTNTTIRKIALADPKAVPAGVYARQALECLHLWPGIGPKVVPTENVRAALAAVESGNVEAGIVYRTDVATSKAVEIACEIPAACAPAIVYPVVLLKDAPHAAEAAKFLAFLQSARAKEVFQRFGFVVLAPKP